jgi:streptomycin 6-kinase
VRPIDVQPLVRRFGSGVLAWHADLPALTSTLAARWELRVGERFDGGNSSVVLRCELPDGGRAVLKLSPDHGFVAEQVRTLGWFAPSGRVPVVLAADAGLGAMLIERIEPGTQAHDGDPPSASEFGALLTALHSAAEVASLPVSRDLRQGLDEFFVRFGGRLTEPAIRDHVRPAHLDLALRRRDELLASESELVLLHGDLHLRNVLDGGPRRGLVAIDPKACVGDPCFDAVDFVLAGAGAEGVDRRCAALAEAGGLDAGRLHAWCRVAAPLIAISLLGQGDRVGVEELLRLAS